MNLHKSSSFYIIVFVFWDTRGERQMTKLERFYCFYLWCS